MPNLRYTRPHTPHCSRRHRRAFTLVETIVCIVILSVAVPGILWALNDATFQRVDPIMANRARWLVQERIEDVLADRHSTTRGYTYIVNGNYPAESPISGIAGYGRTTTITESGANLVAGSGTGYKTVVVTVTYSDARRISRSLALSTVVTDYTP